MSTVIFVHGTSVREPAYTESFNQIQDALRNRRPDVRVVRCYWGEEYGAILKNDGASIPEYDTTRGSVSAEDYHMALWSLLYQDPLYELRTFSLSQEKTGGFVAGKPPAWQHFDKTLRQYKASEQLRTKLARAGIDIVFESAREAVIKDKAYKDSLRAVSVISGEYRAAVSRAIIAAAIAQFEQDQRSASLVINGTLRDEIVDYGLDYLGHGDPSGAGTQATPGGNSGQRRGQLARVALAESDGRPR